MEVKQLVELKVGYELELYEALSLYQPSVNGYIIAIRLFYAQGTTRARIKASNGQYLIDWDEDTQRNIFVSGINKDTLFYDERQKPLFDNIGD